MSDWKVAGVAAFGLLGIAAFLVFATHNGFEGQITLFFALLPGAFFLVTTSEHIPTLKPIFSVATWPFIFFFSYLWYYVLSYLATKIWRARYPSVRDGR
jgi:hypothetical protein